MTAAAPPGTVTVMSPTTNALVADRQVRSDEIAGAVFTLWIVTGLFVDGWAHNVDKPEDFFTPWHFILYSGFVASVLWFAAVGVRRRAAGTATPAPRLILAGYGLFALGGVADGAWHQAFGVEVDIEALLSPTHLLLMTGGLLLTTEAVRSMIARGQRAPTLTTFLPAIGGLTATVAVLAFFTQFASAFRVFDHDVFGGFATEQMQVVGLTAVLLTNALLVGALTWTARRWVTPRGTFTLMFGGAALLMSIESGFDQIWLAGAAVAGGFVADMMLARGASLRTILVVVPGVMWTSWFGMYHAVWGLGWAAELWTGAVFLAVLSGFGLSLLGTTPPLDGETSAPVDDQDDIDAPSQMSRGGATPSRGRTPRQALAQLLM